MSVNTRPSPRSADVIDLEHLLEGVGAISVEVSVSDSLRQSLCNSWDIVVSWALGSQNHLSFAGDGQGQIVEAASWLAFLVRHWGALVVNSQSIVSTLGQSELEDLLNDLPGDVSNVEGSMGLDFLTQHHCVSQDSSDSIVSICLVLE